MRSAAVEQDRAADPVGDRSVDGAGHGGRHRDKDDLVSLADDPQHPVAVFLAEVGDVEAGRFEDPQTQQAKQTDEGEVERVR
jgi:hypothetical protein